jgi:adenylyltransferase/sulfurtransferase
MASQSPDVFRNQKMDYTHRMRPDLSHEEILRYSRHLLIPDVGLDGQRKLKAASALIIGTGGLGSPVALYLAAAGVGRIGLVDYDTVDRTNLQRQVIHGTSTVGTLKVESARSRMLDLNPDITVDIYNQPFTSANALEIAEPYDLIIDGSDNFPTRYLTNDLCVLTGKPNVYGSVYRFEGQVSVFDARLGPCYRCLFPDPPHRVLCPPVQKVACWVSCLGRSVRYKPPKRSLILASVTLSSAGYCFITPRI